MTSLNSLVIFTLAVATFCGCAARVAPTHPQPDHAGEPSTTDRHQPEPLPKPVIKEHITRQKGAVIDCYKDLVAKDSTLEGKVVVRFTITPTGEVVEPSIRSSTVDSAPLGDCIIRALSTFRFPPPSNGGRVRVSYPFAFRTR